MWHYLGEQLAEYTMPAREELYEAAWQPAPPGVFQPPQLSSMRVGAAPIGKVEGKVSLVVNVKCFRYTLELCCG